MLPHAAVLLTYAERPGSRFAWKDLGNPPSVTEGGGGGVKLVDCLDSHRMRAGSLFVLSAVGEVWEISARGGGGGGGPTAGASSKDRWKLHGAPAGSRVAHTSTSVLLGEAPHAGSLFALTTGGSLVELACLDLSEDGGVPRSGSSRGENGDCKWIAHGTPPGVPIGGGLIALRRERAAVVLGTQFACFTCFTGTNVRMLTRPEVLVGVGIDGRVYQRYRLHAAELPGHAEWKWSSLGGPRGDLARMVAPLGVTEYPPPPPPSGVAVPALPLTLARDKVLAGRLLKDSYTSSLRTHTLVA